MSELIDEFEIVAVAKAMTAARGLDPDKIVPKTGYPNSDTWPCWMHDREWAIRHIAAQRILGRHHESSAGGR